MQENMVYKTNINWFPGHMTKALRMMEKEIKIVDAIIYVLDSRAPFSCVNPKLNTLVNGKPIIYILNKVDLADDVLVKEWTNYFNNKPNSKCIVLSSVESGSAKKIESAVKEMLKDKIEKYKNKNISINLRAMVIGVPNSGKSTLINNLCGKAKTITGNKPGVTKGKQWVKIASGLEILDTPGTLWPAFDNNTVAHHLAYIGSIKEEVLDIPTLSLDFIKDINKINTNILKNRYKIDFDEKNTELEILEMICVSRGYKLKGDELDYDRGAYALINDFKQTRLGKITLEKVGDIKKLTKKDRVQNDRVSEFW